MKVFFRDLFFIFYDFLFSFSFFVYLPFYLWRKKITFSSLRKKCGFSAARAKKSLWIQAVSVGEVNLIEPLLYKLNQILDYSLVVSTTTLTGYLVAQKKYAHLAQVVYFPFDLTLLWKNFFQKINPALFIAAETELWPNLIWQLRKKNIPFLIINGRISEGALRRYRLIRPLVKKMLAGCRSIGAQNNQYRRRFLSLGADPRRVVVSGNLKFNLQAPDPEKIKKVKKIFQPVFKPAGQKLFLAASTHHPEEEMILDIYREIYLKENLTLLLAPRHPERASSLEELILARGFSSYPVSRVSAGGFQEAAAGGCKKNVFILDTIGQLIYFYSLADFCFVGGSFFHGGHNILEPLSFCKPVFFGPSMDNFADIARVALFHGAALQVDSPGQLKTEIISLLEDKQKKLNLAKACLAVFKENKSLEQNLEIILKELNAKEKS